MSGFPDLRVGDVVKVTGIWTANGPRETRLQLVGDLNAEGGGCNCCNGPIDEVAGNIFDDPTLLDRLREQNARLG